LVIAEAATRERLLDEWQGVFQRALGLSEKEGPRLHWLLNGLALDLESCIELLESDGDSRETLPPKLGGSEESLRERGQ